MYILQMTIVLNLTSTIIILRIWQDLLYRTFKFTRKIYFF